MIDSELNREIERKLRKLDRPNTVTKLHRPNIGLLIITLMLSLTAIFFLKPEITGFIAAEKQFNYSESLDLEFSESSEYVWVPENLGELSSLRISGSYNKEGAVRVYLEDNNAKYLVFDSGKINESGLTKITGLDVLDLGKTKEDKD
ncbi:hypothetical protein KY347_05735, partial [Candidatus Woesearchaeota archaeon]|nr:hypothetical protein [Candidatus Woesearchaeota archaeon]